jgi:SpoVK/Ycf46/Vps4 family AAA+-type ATPase
MRRVFKQARQCAPCILILEDIDVIISVILPKKLTIRVLSLNFED